MVLGPRDAATVDDEVSAGRLYLELVHQADQPTLTDAQRADTHAAMRSLRTRFPNVEAVARSETSDELGGLPQHLRARQRAMRDEAGHDVNATRAEREHHRAARGRDNAPKPPAPKAPKAPAKASPRSAISSARRPKARAVGGRARRTFRQATPAGSTSLGRLALQSIGTAVGLSLLYLLVRDAERHGNAGAAGVAAGTFAQAISRLVSPTADVFGAGPAVKAPTLSLSDLAGLPDVTGVPVDLSGLPTLTTEPPVTPATRPRPRAPAHPTPTRIPDLANYPH